MELEQGLDVTNTRAAFKQFDLIASSRASSI